MTQKKRQPSITTIVDFLKTLDFIPICYRVPTFSILSVLVRLLSCVKAGGNVAGVLLLTSFSTTRAAYLYVQRLAENVREDSRH